MNSEKENPLLAAQPLPAFGDIAPQHVVPAITQIIAECEAQLPAFYSGPATWPEMVAGEEALLVQLANAWAPVSHLHSVADSPEWREAYTEAVVLLSDFHSRLDQDEARYRAYRALAASPNFDRLSSAQRRQVEITLRDFRLSGADLPAAGQDRFREIRRRLTELGTQFQQNLQDATDHWHLDFDSAEPLAGLPDTELAQASQRAPDGDGFRINLEYPSYHAVMTYADDRALREQVYRAFHTRASDQGPHAGRWDNTEVMLETLALRRELANLVGFDDYAAYSLETKMVADPQHALGFLRSLTEQALPRARDELEALTEYAAEHGAARPLAAWDIGYWSEKLRQSRYDISQAELRPWFPLERAMEGLFLITSQLFGIRFQPRDDVPLWHEDAAYYDVLDEAGTVCAGFYVDLYARKGKRGGAWMANCRDLFHGPGAPQRPVAFLTCNFAPPSGDQPALLNHTELTTLFHEFGHALHHMLTRIPHPAVGGISGVEWDAVEQPSQLLESWCWERGALDQFARHVDSGEALPDDLLDRMLAARHFQSGLFLIRQLEFALLDLRLHRDFEGGDHAEMQRLIDDVRQQVAVVPYPPENRFLHGFGHLFAGGYAAGYYSYLWAEQLAADAFGRFREEGVLNPDTGAEFRQHVLETGGSRPAMASFVAFRGRPPRIEPLLKRYGL